ncbi:MAG: hypothetical protein IT336_04105, partial [Thermomicrobiales bacterium]|nr:hypothetical protein [Thermomicrobiales bacterium]
MDGDRFDQLTRQLATGATRRRVLGGFAAGVGAALSAVAAAGAAQIRRTPGAICRKTGDCVANAVCQSTSTGRSVCTCVTGYKPCGKICIPTSSCCTAADCADDGKECTTTVCTNYVCGHVNRPNGTTCSDG